MGTENLINDSTAARSAETAMGLGGRGRRARIKFVQALFDPFPLNLSTAMGRDSSTLLFCKCSGIMT
jgi:hypothetical protein